MLNVLHIGLCGGSTVRDGTPMRFRAVQGQRPDAVSIFVGGEQQRLGTHNTSRLQAARRQRQRPAPVRAGTVGGCIAPHAGECGRLTGSSPPLPSPARLP
jgi:hypothetical protein